MTLFLLTLLFFFFSGIFLHRVTAWKRALLVLTVSIMLAFIYYTLERFI